MPRYTFRCESCDYLFEKRVRYKKKEDVRCPQCGGEAHDTFAGFLGGKSSSTSASEAPTPPVGGG